MKPWCFTGKLLCGSRYKISRQRQQKDQCAVLLNFKHLVQLNNAPMPCVTCVMLTRQIANIRLCDVYNVVTEAVVVGKARL